MAEVSALKNTATRVSCLVARCCSAHAGRSTGAAVSHLDITGDTGMRSCRGNGGDKVMSQHLQGLATGDLLLEMRAIIRCTQRLARPNQFTAATE
jgi:hypothetical protein